jgi:hypothetical protein
MWAVLPIEWQIAAGIGVPALGIVAGFVVKKTKTTKDDAILDKAKAVWRKLRGQS